MAEEFLGYVLSALGGIVVAIGSAWLTVVRPLEADLAREKRARQFDRENYARQVAAVAAEQMRQRGWGPSSERSPTVRT